MRALALLAGSSVPCPLDVPLSDADLPCDCAGEHVEALPGCGALVCTEDGTAIEGLDDAAADTAAAGCG